jgi:hypothetical protein
MLHKNSAMHDKMVAPDRQMQNVEGRLLHGNQFRTCNLAPFPFAYGTNVTKLV